MNYRINDHLARWAKLSSLAMDVTSTEITLHSKGEGFRDWSQWPGQKSPLMESTTAYLWPRTDLKFEDIGYTLTWRKIVSARSNSPRHATHEWITSGFKPNCGGNLSCVQLHCNPMTTPIYGDADDDEEE